MNTLYTASPLHPDNPETVAILDPEGDTIAVVAQCWADALLSHLNRK
jgi:hypothetical protein